MKKLALALAVTALSSQAMAYNIYDADGDTLDLYGEIRLRYRFEEENGNRMDGDNTRIGVKGQYAVTPETYVFGDVRMEADWNGTDSDFDKTNPAATTPAAENNLTYDRGLVGVGNTKYGEIRAGRMPSIHDIMYAYDISWVYGGTAKNGENYFGTGGETPSLLQYQWTGDNLAVIAQGQGRANTSVDLNNVTVITDPQILTIGTLPPWTFKIKSGLAMGVSYETDFGLGLSTSYTRTELTPDNSTDRVHVSKLDAKSYGVEATYTYEKLDLALAGFKFKQEVSERAVGSIDHNVNQKGFGASARYNFTEDIAVYTVYDYLKSKTKDDSANTYNDRNLRETFKSITLGAQYWPAPQFVTFAEMAHINNNTNKKLENGERVKNTSDNDYAIGARFYF